MIEDYSFGRNLRQMREKQGLSQQQLAERITKTTGVYFNPNRISNWEIGDTKTVSDLVLRQLCPALGCSADQLLGLDPMHISAEEWIMIKRVRNLGPARLKMILNMIDHLYGLRPAESVDG